MNEYLAQLLKWVTEYGLRFLIAAVILIVGWILIGKLAKKVSSSEKLQGKDPTLATFVYSGINMGLKALLVVLCVVIMGVPSATIAALIASCGVVIGLALQGGLSNFAGGLILLFFRPFQVGDFISSSGQDGTVTAINVFYTTILTIDNRKVYFPNGGLANSVLVNVTAEEIRRVDLTYTVTFESDLRKAKEVLKLVPGSNSKVLKDPATAVVVTGYADGAYQLTLRAWCKTSDYWDVFFSIQDKVSPAFAASGITLGHPHLNVHLDNEEK